MSETTSNNTSSVDPGSIPSDSHQFLIKEKNEEVEKLIKDIVRE